MFHLSRYHRSVWLDKRKSWSNKLVECHLSRRFNLLLLWATHASKHIQRKVLRTLGVLSRYHANRSTLSKETFLVSGESTTSRFPQLFENLALCEIAALIRWHRETKARCHKNEAEAQDWVVERKSSFERRLCQGVQRRSEDVERSIEYRREGCSECNAWASW